MSFIDERDLEFLLYRWLRAEELARAPRYAEHSRETFDAAIALGARLACRLGLGHPMGPFELMDATTSSLCLQAQEIMFAAYGERFRPRPLMKSRVRAGYGGGKGKPGWRSAR